MVWPDSTTPTLELSPHLPNLVLKVRWRDKGSLFNVMSRSYKKTKILACVKQILHIVIELRRLIHLHTENNTSSSGVS